MTLWTDTADQFLRAEWAKGTPSRQIAEMLTDGGFPATRNSVLGRAFRLKLDTHARYQPRKSAPLEINRPDFSKPLPPTGCRWIPGEPKGFQTKWCDKPIERPGESWCAEHRSICLRPYVPPPKKTDGLAMVAMADLGKARRAA